MGVETGLEPATIASGASLSGAIHLHNQRLFAIVMPSSWTAANLTFQGSHDGSTYFDVYNDAGTEVTVVAAASRFIIIASPVALLGLQRLKVRSGTSGSPVNQGADRALQLSPLA